MVLIAGGPSLSQRDVNYCRGRSRVIAINDAYRLAPWADALYACDASWWDVHRGVTSFAGAKYSHSRDAAIKWGLWWVDGRAAPGLSADPRYIHLGGNGGYQAMGISKHFGAKKLVLLGFDMQDTGGRSHWFGDHPEECRKARAFPKWIKNFEGAVPNLQAAGITVINASRETALTCFKRLAIEDAL